MSFRQMVPGLILAFSLISTPAFAAPPEQARGEPGGGGGVLSLLPPDAVSDHVLDADGKRTAAELRERYEYICTHPPAHALHVGIGT